MVIAQPDLVRVKELAQRCDTSPATIYRLVRAGRLPSVRVGPRTIRIPAEAAEAFLRGEGDSSAA